MKKVILSAALAFTFAYAGAQTSPQTMNTARVAQEGSTNLGLFNQNQIGASGNILSAKQMNGDNNIMDVDQEGNNNIAGRDWTPEKMLLQKGSGNDLGVVQLGDNNRAMAEQVGEGSLLRVNSEGNDNKAGRGFKKLTQLGDDHEMDIIQNGDRNKTYIEQEGLVHETAGSGNITELTQEGDDNNFGFAYNTSVQQGVGNEATVDQLSNSNTGRLIQIGEENKAFLTQEFGEENKAFITSLGGNENEFHVKQLGGSNTLNTSAVSEEGRFGQDGSSNMIKMRQVSNKNQAWLLQRNNSNTILADQLSTQSSLTSYQIGDGNTLKSMQYGTLNNSVFSKQKGNSNEATIQQLGMEGQNNNVSAVFGTTGTANGSISNLTQTGSSNELSLTVTNGEGNISTVEQTGNLNQASDEGLLTLHNTLGNTIFEGESFDLGLIQTGNDNELTLNQFGDSNEAGIQQNGFGLKADMQQKDGSLNFGFIQQSGMNHKADLMQSGGSNQAVIYQK